MQHLRCFRCTENAAETLAFLLVFLRNEKKAENPVLTGSSLFCIIRVIRKRRNTHD